MPKHAVKTYGSFIRQALSKCPKEAGIYGKRLSDVLEGSWSGTTEIISPIWFWERLYLPVTLITYWLF